MLEDKLSLLNKLLARCCNSSFYRQRLPGRDLDSLEDFKRIPLTTKEDLRNNSPFGLICVPREHLLQYHETFGTTGTPVSIWLTKGDLVRNAKAIAGLGVGFNAEDIVLIRYPYAISGVAHMVHDGAQLKKACVIPASSRTMVSPFPRIINLLRKLNVTILASLPMQAVLLAETAELMGLEPSKDFPALRAICTAGEPLPPGKRKMLSELWKAPIYDNYGMTEIGPLILDCKYGTPHPLVDDFLIEILDEDLQTEVKPGAIGYLVITTLRREATPMVRLFTGDRGRLVKKECPCGIDVSLEIHGRLEDTIKIGKKVLDVFDLDEMISNLPCRRFWAAGPEQAVLRLLVEAENKSDEVPSGLVGIFENKHGIPLHVEILPKGSLFNRRELLEVNTVGKPQYIFSAQEMLEKKYLLSSKA